jgi:hypothetical protein
VVQRTFVVKVVTLAGVVASEVVAVESKQLPHVIGHPQRCYSNAFSHLSARSFACFRVCETVADGVVVMEVIATRFSVMKPVARQRGGGTGGDGSCGA